MADIENQVPAPDTNILPTKRIEFDVTDAASPFSLHLVYEDGEVEVAWNGEVFMPFFMADSIRTGSSPEYHFVLYRTGGWRKAPTVTAGDPLDAGAATAYGLAPPAIAAAGAAGASGQWADGAHTHAHDGATAATANKLALRGASGVCSFGALTAPSIASSTTSFSALNSAGEGLTITSGNVSLGSTNNISGSATGNISLLCDTDAEIVAGGAISLSGDAGASLTATTGTATVSAATTVGITASSGAVSISGSAGVINLQKNGSTAVVCTVDNAGACTIAPVGGASSLTIKPAQKTSGAGAAVTIAGGQGSSGNVGGKTTVGANNGATPGTNLAGGVDIELGQTVGGVSALASVVANGTTLCTFQQTASAQCEISNLALIWLKGASGCLIGSNDDAVRIYCNQSDGTITIKGTSGAVRIQDTSVTWLEMARVAAGRNVVSLAAGANLDTTKMPANTGNGVVFLANAATAPTVSSDSTGTIIYGESSQVRVRETNGFASALNYIDDSAGGTLKREIKSLGRATTSSTTITTITTIRAAQMPGKGCGIAIIRGFGYDTVTDTVSGYFCRRVVILSVSGALTIVDDDPIGTDALGGGTLTIDVSTDVRVRIQCKDTSNTRWTATVDMHYVEH